VNEIFLYILGILIMIIGLAISIGLHEFGHLIPAKLFGVKVPHWAVGFGPKLFAKKIGETEYSIRAIPLGGFITMIGMYPPANPNKPDEKRKFGGVIAQSREAHSEHMEPGDESRTLYSKPAWQRIIIMLGGPTVNLILGILLITVALSGIGTWTQGTKVEAVIECQEQMINTEDSCTADSIRTPAVLAGLQNGDVILSVDGVAVSTAAPVLEALTAKPLVSHKVLVDRNGTQKTLNILAVEASLPTLDPSTGETVTQVRPYVGVRMEFTRVQLGIGESISYGWSATEQTFGFIAQFPQQVYSALYATVTGQDRSIDSAISVVGIGQVAGQVASSEGDGLDKAFSTLMLLGSLNLALFAFNMIPLPPLDGGHVAGGLYEYLKRGAYRLLGKKDPGPVDTALMAPVAQFMFLALLAAGLLMILADIFNPISF
jgi:membrane-associated protease RseP (regulator of RpoE activity)